MRAPLPRQFRYFAFVVVALVATPLVALLWRVPWSRIHELLREQVVVDALILSLVTSLIAAGTALLLGIPVALILSRMEGIKASITRALMTLPMVLPPVVGGAALLFAFGRNGVLGSSLEDVTGLSLIHI